MKNKILIGISLTLAAFNSSSNTLDQNGLCKEFKINELIQEMKISKEFFAKNPFDTNCVPFLLHTAEKPELTVEDFNNQKWLFNEYKNLLNKENGGFEVITLYTPNDGKFYQFFKVDENSEFLKETKDIWSKNRNKNIALLFDDFIKLHEIAHLDFEAIKDIRGDHNAIETLADISAVVMLSVEKELTVKETIDFLQSINDIRKSKLMIKVGKDTGHKKSMYDENGNKISEVGHYDRKLFSKAIRDLKSIKNQDQIFKMTNLMINIKDENVVKFIRDRYKPK